MKFFTTLVTPSTPKVPIITRGSPIQPHFKPSPFNENTLIGKNANPRLYKLPNSVSTKLSNFTKQKDPQQLRRQVAQIFKTHKTSNLTPVFDRDHVQSRISAYFVHDLANCTYALKELQKRLPNFNPKSVLNITFGPATGLLAAREVFKESTFKEVCMLIGHPEMKQKASELLKTTLKTQFRHDLPVGTQFDLVILDNQLLQVGSNANEMVISKTEEVARLVNTKGALVFVENGDPIGFECIALARQTLLKKKYAFNSIAPCTHNNECPLQTGLLKRINSKRPHLENWCSFTQLIQRDQSMLELKRGQYLMQKWSSGFRGEGGNSLKGGGRPNANSFEKTSFAYLCVYNGNHQSMGARILKQPMKRHKHVTMEVCNEQISHITVPKSQGKLDYHDARKANEGDVWMLSAKSSQLRGGLKNKLEEGEVVMDKCVNWWDKGVNPYFKYSGHHARVRNETNRTE